MLPNNLRSWVTFVAVGFFAVALASCSGGGNSSSQPAQPTQPTVTPSISSTSPATISAGQGAFQLQVNGTGFLPGATVMWNGSARPTTLSSGGTLSVSIGASDVAVAGTVQITVVDPAPNGGTSTPFSFTVTAVTNSAPALSSISPSPVFAGGATITITANGANFTGQSVIQWNGNNQETTYVSATQLQASIFYNLIPSPQSVNVDVVNGPPGGGTSNAVTLPVVPGGTPAGVIDRASVATNGAQVSGSSRHAAITPDGRFIAFESVAWNLISGGTNGSSQIFVRDTCFGGPQGCQPSTAIVSVAGDGTEGNADSYMPAISPDGRFVAFESLATNLTPSNVGSTINIFIHDRDSDQNGIFDEPGAIITTLVSSASDGTPGDQASRNPAIGAGGRFVAFESDADNLVPNDTNLGEDVFLRDTCALAPSGCVPSTVRVSVASDGGQAEGGVSLYSTGASISADGRFVSFASTAVTLVPNKTNFGADVYLRDTCFGAAACTPSTTRVSLTSDGSQSLFGGEFSSMSADARFIAFISEDLTGDAPSNTQAVFVRDTCQGVTTGCSPTTRLASVGNGGTYANGDSNFPAISPDGRFVGFQSAATNLAVNNPSDTNQQQDFFVYDTCIGAPSGCTPLTFQVSLANDGTQSQGEQGVEGPNIQISADGQIVVFASDATNLVPNDTNQARDIFRVVSNFQ